MQKTINIEPFDLDENDTICGYKVKDLLATVKVLEAENITVADLRKFVSNLEFAYKVVQNELNRQFDKQMSRFSGEN